MNALLSLPMAMIRDLVAVVDEPIEEAIIAHGFSFSALTADQGGARLCYTQAMAAWRLTILSSPESAPSMILERGSATEPSLRLQLTPDGASLANLADALAVAMTLFDRLDQS